MTQSSLPPSHLLAQQFFMRDTPTMLAPAQKGRLKGSSFLCETHQPCSHLLRKAGSREAVFYARHTNHARTCSGCNNDISPVQGCASTIHTIFDMRIIEEWIHLRVLKQCKLKRAQRLSASASHSLQFLGAGTPAGG